MPYNIAIITISDSASKGEKEDLSGIRLQNLLQTAFPHATYSRHLVPDDMARIHTLFAKLAPNCALIASTGGTGPSPRDVTPEAVLPLITKHFHGMEQLMMAASLAHTPKAALSRLVAGAIGPCLTLCLPGSPKAVQENMEAILPILPHALEKLAGDTTPCG